MKCGLLLRQGVNIMPGDGLHAFSTTEGKIKLKLLLFTLRGLTNLTHWYESADEASIYTEHVRKLEQII